MKILIFDRSDVTTLLGKDWMKKFNLTNLKHRSDGNNQSDKRRTVEKIPSYIKSTPMKDTEIIIQFTPVHYPVKQKVRPIPLHLQEEVSKK